MRTLVLLIMLYCVHRLLLANSPRYQARMRRLDHKITWLNVVLVVYFAVNFVMALLRYMRQGE